MMSMLAQSYSPYVRSWYRVTHSACEHLRPQHRSTNSRNRPFHHASRRKTHSHVYGKHISYMGEEDRVHFRDDWPDTIFSGLTKGFIRIEERKTMGLITSRSNRPWKFKVVSVGSYVKCTSSCMEVLGEPASLWRSFMLTRQMSRRALDKPTIWLSSIKMVPMMHTALRSDGICSPRQAPLCG
jgi:hypothetical protein